MGLDGKTYTDSNGNINATENCGFPLDTNMSQHDRERACPTTLVDSTIDGVIFGRKLMTRRKWLKAGITDPAKNMADEKFFLSSGGRPLGSYTVSNYNDLSNFNGKHSSLRAMGVKNSKGVAIGANVLGKVLTGLHLNQSAPPINMKLNVPEAIQAVSCSYPPQQSTDMVLSSP